MKEYKLNPVLGGTALMILEWCLDNPEVRKKLDDFSKDSLIHYTNMTQLTVDKLKRQFEEINNKHK